MYIHSYPLFFFFLVAARCGFTRVHLTGPLLMGSSVLFLIVIEDGILINCLLWRLHHTWESKGTGRICLQTEYHEKKKCCRVARGTKASGNLILVFAFSLQHIRAAALLFPALWDHHIKIRISQASGFGTETSLFFSPQACPGHIV